LLEKVHPDCEYALSSSAIEGLLTIPEKDTDMIEEDVYQAQLADLIITDEYIRMATSDPEGDEIYQRNDSAQVIERRYENIEFIDSLESGLKFGTGSKTYRVELGDGIPGLKQKVERAGGYIREKIKETGNSTAPDPGGSSAADTISDIRSSELISDIDLSEEEIRKLGNRLSTAAGFLQDKFGEMRGSESEGQDPVERLRELSELKEEGILSEEEFEEKKQELLDDI
jgi:hypothetical protein